MVGSGTPDSFGGQNGTPQWFLDPNGNPTLNRPGLDFSNTSPVAPPPLSGLGAFGNNIDNTPILGAIKPMITQPIQDVATIGGSFIPGDPFGITSPGPENLPGSANKFQPSAAERASTDLFGMGQGNAELGLAAPAISALGQQAALRGGAAVGRVAADVAPKLGEFSREEAGLGRVDLGLSGGKPQFEPVQIPGGRWSIRDAQGNIDPNVSLKDQTSALNVIAKRTNSMQDVARAAFGDFANPETAAKLEAERVAKQAEISASYRDAANAEKVNAAVLDVPQDALASVRQALQNGDVPKVDTSALDAGLSARGVPITDANRAALEQKVVEQSAEANKISGFLGRPITAEEQAAADKFLAETPVPTSFKKTVPEPAAGAIEAPSAPVEGGKVIAQNVDQGVLIEKMREAGATEQEIASALGLKVQKAKPPSGAPPAKPPTAGGTGGTTPPTPPSGGGKLGVIEQASGILKSTTTAGAPFHGMFRHNLPFLIKDPKAWAQGWKGGFEAFKDPQLVGDRLGEMKAFLDATPGAEKLYIGKPHGGAALGEEEIPSSFLEKLPVYGELAKRSGAGFTMANNEVKFSALQNAIEAAKRQGKPLTAEETAGVAQAINRLGGRGFETNTEFSRNVARALNVPFFSPQLKASRVRIYTDALAALPQYFLSKGADPVAAYKVYGALSHAAGVGAVLGAAKLAGFNVNINPTSPGFLTADMGPIGGVAGGAAAALGSQLGWSVKSENGRNYADVSTGEAPIIKAFVQSLFGKPNVAGTMIPPKDRFAPWGTLGLNSLAPGIGDAVRALQGKQTDLSSLFMGMTLADALKGSGTTPTPTYRDGLGRIDDGALPATPVTDAWDAAMKANPSLGDLTAPDRNVGTGQNKVVLDDPETDRLRVLTGNARQTLMSQVVASPAYLQGDPATQEKLLKGAKTEADRQGQVAFGLEQAQKATTDLTRALGARVGEMASPDGAARMDYLSKLQQQGSLTPVVQQALDDLRTQKDPLKNNYQPTVAEYLKGNDLVNQYLKAPAYVAGTPQDWKEVAVKAESLQKAYSTLQKMAQQQSTASKPVRIEQLSDYQAYLKDWQTARTTSGVPIAAFVDRDATIKPQMVTPQRRAIAADPLFKRTFATVAQKRDPYSPKSVNPNP